MSMTREHLEEVGRTLASALNRVQAMLAELDDEPVVVEDDAPQITRQALADRIEAYAKAYGWPATREIMGRPLSEIPEEDWPALWEAVG